MSAPTKSYSSLRSFRPAQFICAVTSGNVFNKWFRPLVSSLENGPGLDTGLTTLTFVSASFRRLYSNVIDIMRLIHVFSCVRFLDSCIDCSYAAKTILTTKTTTATNTATKGAFFNLLAATNRPFRRPPTTTTVPVTNQRVRQTVVHTVQVDEQNRQHSSSDWWSSKQPPCSLQDVRPPLPNVGQDKQCHHTGHDGEFLLLCIPGTSCCGDRAYLQPDQGVADNTGHESNYYASAMDVADDWTNVPSHIYWTPDRNKDRIGLTGPWFWMDTMHWSIARNGRKVTVSKRLTKFHLVQKLQKPNHS